MWQTTFLIVVVLRFSSLLPAPPGMAGVYEFVTMSALATFAVGPAAGLRFAMVTHLVIFAPPLLITAIMMAVERGTMMETVRAALQPLRSRTLRPLAPDATK